MWNLALPTHKLYVDDRYIKKHWGIYPYIIVELSLRYTEKLCHTHPLIIWNYPLVRNSVIRTHRLYVRIVTLRNLALLVHRLYGNCRCMKKPCHTQPIHYRLIISTLSNITILNRRVCLIYFYIEKPFHIHPYIVRKLSSHQDTLRYRSTDYI